MLTASVLLAILCSVATAQPHGYTSMGELISDDSSMHGDRRELGWQRFYSRTHSHEEEYDTTRAWPGGGPGMYRAESQPGTPGIMNALVEADGVTPVTYEMPGLRGAWSGGDVRLDRTDDKWPEQVRQNCTDPTATGIETLPSGLQYKVLTQGSGTEYPRDDTPCDIHYTARKGVSGAVFESTYDRGLGAALVTPGQSIAAWKEALQMMVEGDRWEVYAPSEMVLGPFNVWYGYGECFVFTIELLELTGGRQDAFSPPPPSPEPPPPEPMPPGPPPSSPPFFG